MYRGLEKLQELSKDFNMPMEEAALRWIVHHSVLGEGDGVILGASKVTQVQINTEEISHGALPAELAKSLEALWDIVKDEAHAINPPV